MSDTELLTNLGKKMKTWRLEGGFTITELAHALNDWGKGGYRFTPSELRIWEKGQGEPYLNPLKIMVDFHGLQLDDVFED